MKQTLLVVVTILLYMTATAQTNYSYTNTRFSTGVYNDISSTGTAITMTNAESGSSITPINIGFSFSFNGTAFTQCMIHADGILRFGAAAPGSHTTLFTNNAASGSTIFTTTSSTYQNVLLPLFMDLVQGTAAAAYHVETQGVSPNRVTTIQWKNLKDNNISGVTNQNQYDNLEFQVKLYETSNDIQFVYGNFVPSANTAVNRNAQVGIKGSGTSFIGLRRNSSIIPFDISEFLNPVAHAVLNAIMPLRNVILPTVGSGFIFYGQRTNDINISEAYIENSVIRNASAPMHNKVMVKNEGTAPASGIDVTMQITGANPFTQTINIPALAAGSDQVIDFSGYSISNTGEQSVSFTTALAGDERTENNTVVKSQKVTNGFVQPLEESLNQKSGFGFNGTSNNEVAVRMYATGIHKIAQIRIPFITYTSNISIKILDDDGTGASPGTVLHTSPSVNTNADNETIYNLAVPLTVTGDYFISIRQNNTLNMGWLYASQYPTHPNRIYNGNGFSYTLQNAERVFHPILKVIEENSQPDLGINSVTSPLCTYGTAVPVSVSVRNYSNVMHDFSVNPVTINGTVINDVTNTPIPFSIVKNTGTLSAGGSEAITVLGSYDFSIRGTHTIIARTEMTGDAEPQNDSLTYRIVNSLRINKSFTDSVCPFTSVTLTIPTGYYSNIEWTDGNVNGYSNDFTVAPAGTSIVRASAIDYRGCTISDSVIVAVRSNDLPPAPVITFNDTILSHRNRFSDTLSVSNLAGHSVNWIGAGSVINGGLSYVAKGNTGQDPELHIAYYRNISTGCGSNGTPITTRFSAGLLMSDNNNEILCDTSFYDSGGPTGSYFGSNNFTKTFYPGTPGSKIKLSIYDLQLGQFANMRIYDGANTSAPRLDQLTYTSPNILREYTGSNKDGSITVSFTANSSSALGWLAGITCEAPLQFRSVQSGLFTEATTWESKLPADAAYSPAFRRPFKGDDTIIIRHAVNLPANSSLPLDQTVIETSGTLTVPNSTFMQVYSDTTGHELIVNGILTVNGGISGSPDPLTDGKILLAGTLNIGGQITVNAVSAGPAGSLVTINATGSASISRLEVNNPSGVNINGNLNISRLLHLQNGVLTISPSNYIRMIAGEGPQLQGGSALSYINGKMRWQSFSTVNPLIFPMGKNGVARTIELIANQTSYDNYVEYEAEMFTGVPPSRTLPAGISNVNQQWYHNISIISGNGYFTDGTVTIHYKVSDGIADPSTLRVAKDDGGSDWIDIGGTATGSPEGSIVSNSFTSFSDFILANINGSALPVTLLSFNGKAIGSTVALNWKVENEEGFAYYQVERSVDGTIFAKLGTITAGGLSGYQYSDAQLPSTGGLLYYRLKLVDRDGSFKYSSIIQVRWNNTWENMSIAPNPFTDYLTIRLKSAGRESVMLQLLDMEGKVLKNAALVVGPGLNQLHFETDNLPRGMYLLKIITAGNVSTKKLIRR